VQSRTAGKARPFVLTVASTSVRAAAAESPQRPIRANHIAAQSGRSQPPGHGWRRIPGIEGVVL